MVDIDRAMISLAEDEFPHLRLARANCGELSVRIADGRLFFRSYIGKGFDIIVLDAFSGDSVPVHLLTVEGLREMTRVLTADGIFAVHVSSRHLDVDGVVIAGLEELGNDAFAVVDRGNGTAERMAARWVFGGKRQVATELRRVLESADDYIQVAPFRGVAPWTDQRHPILSVLK